MLNYFVLAVLVIVAAFTSFHTYAQDVIMLKNGEEIKAKVEEISSTEVKYKRFDNLGGPTIVVEKEKVFAINYENGTREIINTITEKPKEQETQLALDNKKERAKSNVGIFFNPGGFLLFGPMVGAEFTAGLFDIEVHLIFPQAGFVANLLMSGGENHTAEGGIGFSIVPKFYMNRTKGGLYAGGFVGYWRIPKVVYYDNYDTPAGVMFGTNIGYKFVLPFGLYFRTGAYLGANVNVNYKEYRLNGTLRDDYSGNVTVFANLDLTIGFKLLKVKR